MLFFKHINGSVTISKVLVIWSHYGDSRDSFGWFGNSLLPRAVGLTRYK